MSLYPANPPLSWFCCRPYFQIRLDFCPHNASCRDPYSLFFPVLWYSPSVSLWCNFIWMLLEHLWVGEGGGCLLESERCFWITSLYRQRLGIQSKEARRPHQSVLSHSCQSQSCQTPRNITVKKSPPRYCVFGIRTGTAGQHTGIMTQGKV